MSVELFLTLLLCSTIATMITTEAFKKLLNASETQYRANAVALDASMICGTLMGLIFKTYLGLGLSFSAEQVMRLLLVILSTWFTSMYVYDKLMQTIRQYKKYYSLKQADEKFEKSIIEKFSDTVNKR